MRLLGEIPALRLGAKRPLENEGFASAQWCTEADLADAISYVANDTSAVLVLDAAIDADPIAEAITIDDGFELSQTPIGFVSRSAVTGLFLTRGAILVPPNQKVHDLSNPSVTLPYSIGTYRGHATPEDAFANGFNSGERKPPSSDTERATRALAASLGQDALNGGWWVLGALSALGQTSSLADAWLELEWLLDSPNEMGRHISGLSRAVHQSSGVPVQPLSQNQSRTLKTMLPEWPDSAIWRRFLADCQDLGPKPRAVAGRMCQAAARVWPDLQFEITA